MLKRYIKIWLFWLAIAGVSFALAMQTHQVLYFYFFWCVAAYIILGFSVAYCQKLFSRLSLSRVHANRLEEDDILEIRMDIENKGGLAAWNILLEDNLPCASEGAHLHRQGLSRIFAKEALSLRYGLSLLRRGIYRLGPVNAYFFDFTGIFFFKETLPCPSELYVLPRLFKIAKFPPLRKGVLPWFGIDSAHVSGDEDEFFGVREYRSGDTVSKIHWLSSARKNNLIVKQFQRQNFYRATVIFTLEKSKNYGQGRESVAEYMISIAASITRYLIEQNIAVELVAHSGEFVHIPLSKGSEQLDNMYTFFAAAQANSTVSLGELFEDYYPFIPSDSNVIVIMLDEDWEHFMRMLPLEKRNLYFIPFVLVSSTFKYKLDKKEIVQDVSVKLAGEFNCAPIFFSRGDNPEEIFLRQ